MFLKATLISTHSSFTLHDEPQHLQPQLGYRLLDHREPYVNKLSHAPEAFNEIPSVPSNQKLRAWMPHLGLNQLQKKWIYVSIKLKIPVNFFHLWVNQIHSPMLENIQNAYLCMFQNAIELKFRVVCTAGESFHFFGDVWFSKGHQTSPLWSVHIHSLLK